MPPAHATKWLGAHGLCGLRCPSLGCVCSPILPFLLFEMWVLCLCVDLCHFAAIHRCTHWRESSRWVQVCTPQVWFPPRCIPCWQPRSCTQAPRGIGEAALAATGGDRRCQQGDSWHWQARFDCSCLHSHVSFDTKFSCLFIHLLRLIPPLFQKSLCNPPVTV